MSATNTTKIEQALSNRPATVCFSGHRPGKLPDYGDTTKPAMGAVYQSLLDEIEKAVHAGKTNFLHGMMAGFDLIAAQAVLDLKAKYPQIKLFSIAPFHAGFFYTKEWISPDSVAFAKKIVLLSDYYCSLEERYSPGVYYRRNEWLVDHSSLLICYCINNSGGTAYTSDYAYKQGTSVINLADKFRQKGGVMMNYFRPNNAAPSKMVSRTCRIQTDLDKRIAELAAKNQLSYSEVMKQCIEYALSHMKEE